MRIAAIFTNFGPYHLARLRALAARWDGELIAYEVAGAERLYPWLVERRGEPFNWVTLFPGRDLEDLSGAECAEGMRHALERDRPGAVLVAGYARPESMAALGWARRRGRAAVLMSESQRLDHPRTWWKEAIKGRRVRRFSAALVGGPRHRDYLVDLGMDPDRIALGYNAVDNAYYAAKAEAARRSPEGRRGLPERPYFLAVNRFVPEKNLATLIRGFARFRAEATEEHAWDLVLCGGGPGAEAIEEEGRRSGFDPAIHRPGFLQADELSRWYAFASAFVHPSLLEPWGLVVNEAAACGLPLLVSERAGCVETLVPDPPGTTGLRIDPRDEPGLARALAWLASQSAPEREAMGRRAREVVAAWGPERFADGAVEAIGLARAARRGRRGAAVT
jgi:glycosyltransferase involved in cell wall biosynthesis